MCYQYISSSAARSDKFFKVWYIKMFEDGRVLGCAAPTALGNSTPKVVGWLIGWIS